MVTHSYTRFLGRSPTQKIIPGPTTLLLECLNTSDSFFLCSPFNLLCCPNVSFLPVIVQVWILQPAWSESFHLEEVVEFLLPKEKAALFPPEFAIRFSQIKHLLFAHFRQ